MARRRSGPIDADQVHAGRAQRLHREEIAEQRTVGDIDRKGPAHDVLAPGRLVARQDSGRAGVLAERDCVACDVGDIGRVAQSQIEALRADRRHHVSGFADQSDAVFRESAAAARSPVGTDSGRARPGRGRRSNATASPRLRTVRRRSAPSAVRLPPAKQPTPRCSGRRAGARTRMARTAYEIRWRHSRAAGLGDIEGQCRLLEFAAMDLDAGCVAAKRMPAISADHKPRRQHQALARAYADFSVVGRDRLRLVVEPGQAGKLGRALFERRRSASDCRCCSRTGRGRSRPMKTALPAHGSAVRYRRPGAWPAAAPPCRGSAARRRAVREGRWTHRAAPWCGCRHKARGGRAGRSARRYRASAIAAVRPAGPPPMTTAS